MLFQEIKEVVNKRVKIRKDKAMKERLIRNIVPVDAMQSRTMSPTCVVDLQLEKERSFSLTPLYGVLPLMS